MAPTTPIRFVRSPKKQSDNSGILLASLLLLPAGLSIFFMAVFFITIGFRLMYIGRIFPGVQVAGVDVSGMKPDAAAEKIRAALTFPTSGRIVLRDGLSVWVETPTNLGMILDARASAQVALDFGRKAGFVENINDQLNAAQVGVILPPVIIIDQNVAFGYLQNLSVMIDRPPVEASLAINGLDVAAQPGQLGRRLDAAATMVYISTQMQLFRDGEVALVVNNEAPQVMEVGAQAEFARRLLASPFSINLPEAKPGDPGPWQIQPAQLAPMLRIGRQGSGPGSQYVVQFDYDSLKVPIEEIARQANRPEADARFIFNDATGQIELIKSSVIGLEVNVRASIDQIQKSVAAGQQSVPVVVKATLPKVLDTATNQQLGITQLISSQTTYFYGSSAARRTNIERAASNFNGLLVAPGAVFSMGEHMGDVSLDSGYAEALIIYNGKTIKGVGGGVCQVSTTLFRTVFFAGLPVVERHAHAYRVYYYEQTPGGQNDPSLSGFDATVYFPLVDFKFKNDTPYWILMETSFAPDGSSLTWNLYSTPDGRAVQATFSGPTNISPPPPPVISYNPDAASGSVSHVDYAAEGADVVINRSVSRGGLPLFDDKFVTNYQPWADACEYGPDVKDPEKILKERGWCQKH